MPGPNDTNTDRQSPQRREGRYEVSHRDSRDWELKPDAGPVPVVCIKHADRRIADPQPDNPKTDITGRYEDVYEGMKKKRLTININQAVQSS